MIRRYLRYAVRHSIKSPTFTLTCITTLAIGIGANAAIFSVLNAVLLHPAGVAQPERVAVMNVRHTKLGLDTPYVSIPDLMDAASLKDQVEAAAFARNVGFNIVHDGSTEHLIGERVSSQWFKVFGAQPILGRTFTAEEDQPSAGPVVVLSYGTWQTFFAGQSNIIGQKITLDLQPYEVIGVMGQEFSEPKGKQLWVPIGLPPATFASNQRFHEDYIAVLRLRPGASLQRLNAGLAQKVYEVNRQDPGNQYGARSGWNFYAARFTEFAARPLRTPLQLLLAFVGLILLIASANVAGLLLARSAGRSKDFAIQTALGAPPSALVWQLLVEALLLSAAAVLVAIAVAPGLGKLLLSLLPLRMTQGFAIHIDSWVLAFTAAAGVATSIVAGLGPVLRTLQDGRNMQLNAGNRTKGGSVAIQRLHNAFVIGQVALACLLLSAAGLFFSSLRKLQQVELGFNSHDLKTALVVYSGREFKSNPVKQASFVGGVVDQLSARPGVVAAAAVEPLPFDPDRVEFSSFTLEGQLTKPGSSGYQSSECYATPGYLRAIEIPLLSGRWIANEDRADTAPVVVIDETLKRKYWPNQDPVGQRLRSGDRKPWATIIGVVGSVRTDLLEGQTADGVRYYPFAQGSDIAVNFVIRSAYSSAGLLPVMKSAVASIGPDQAVSSVTPMEAIISNLFAGRRIIVYTLVTFAGIAVLLAILGLYGLTSYLAAQRTSEIGIRMALGAQRFDVIWLILSRMLHWILLGLCIGLIMSFGAMTILRHQFVAFGGNVVSIFFGAALLLFVTGAMAGLVTAFRAAFIDPLRAMQYE